jgi:hypothetical protein
MKPIYLLNVEEIASNAIRLIVRTADAGVTTGRIKLPEWQELAAGYDGPHQIDVALHLADTYAEAYGYYAIAIDIESSQLWDPAWGALNKGVKEHTSE